MVGLLLTVLGIFVIILVGSLQVDDSTMRGMFVRFLSCASLISTFASPLFIIVCQLFPRYPSFNSFCIFCPLNHILLNLFTYFVYVTSQKLVIQTKSVEFMPFYLSISTFLMSISFFLYGFLSDDAFIYVRVLQFISYFLLKYSFSFESLFCWLLYAIMLCLCLILQVPNGIGTVLGIIQLVLYFYYKGSSSEECREPLIVSYE